MRRPGRPGRAGHQRDQLGAGRRLVAHVDVGDLLPEPHHGDAVGHAQHLLHVVADEHDRHAVRAQPLDEREHELGLAHAERRSRLVHDHDVAAPHDGARDRDGLPLPARERADLAAQRRQRDAEAVEGGLHLLAHDALLEVADGAPEGTGPAALALEEDVLGDVERGDQREVLEDRLDAGVARVRRAREAPLGAVHEHPALVGPQSPRHHAHERALAGAVVADQPEHLAGAAARG